MHGSPSIDYDYTTQTQLRDAFWEAHPQYTRRGRRVRQNDYNATIRTAFVDWIDFLQKDGQISEHLASRVIL